MPVNSTRWLLATCIAVAIAARCFPLAEAQPPQPGDYSEAKYEVVSELDRKAPMRDGARLRIDIFRPDDTQPKQVEEACFVM